MKTDQDSTQLLNDLTEEKFSMGSSKT